MFSHIIIFQAFWILRHQIKECRMHTTKQNSVILYLNENKYMRSKNNASLLFLGIVQVYC
jgi:hypothetical protein